MVVDFTCKVLLSESADAREWVRLALLISPNITFKIQKCHSGLNPKSYFSHGKFWG